MTFPSENKAGNGEGVLQGDVTQSKKGLIVLQEWWGLNEQIQVGVCMVVTVKCLTFSTIRTLYSMEFKNLENHVKIS